MRNKIAILSVCITLVYWLGGLTGCATSPQDAQNEEMLKEDKPLLDPTPPGVGGNQFQTRNSLQIDVRYAAMQTAETVTEEVSVDTPAEPVAKQPVASDTGVSVTGLDRSGWSPITASPMIGTVKHGYIYHVDQPDRLYTHTVVDLEQGQEAAMTAALDDTQCHTLDKREWATTLIQPLKFCWDTFTLPYNATVKKPFWVDTKQGE